MNTQVKIIKNILGIIGVLSFIAVFGAVGNVEQNVGDDITNLGMALFFIGLTSLCAWLNSKIDQAFDDVDF